MKKILVALFILHYSIALFSFTKEDPNIGPVNPSTASKPVDPINAIRPVEPTTASLGQYGSYPVSNSTGTIPITIPLYEVKSGELTQLIELRYHGGGIRVNEDASWVGLGWDVYFGGSICRCVNGFPDEEEAYTAMPKGNTLDSRDVTKYNLFEMYANPTSGAFSFKQDIYNYSCSNTSGTFVGGQTNLFISQTGLQINQSSENGFDLTDSKGIIYSYLPTEKTTVIDPKAESTGRNRMIYNSAFSISKICSPNTADEITFEYQKDGTYMKDFTRWSQGFKNILDMSWANKPMRTQFINIGLTSNCYQINKIESSKIKYIYFRGGRVEFIIGERSDISYLSNINKLEVINIQVKRNNEYVNLKSIRFIYCYFNESSGPDSQRLCLIGVMELADDKSKTIANFDYYYTHPLPSKNDVYNVDYWGYFNGANNKSAIPFLFYNDSIHANENRIPNESFCTSGILKSITHPTKGKTEFVWESNRVNDVYDDFRYPMNPSITESFYLNTPTDHNENNLETETFFVTNKFNKAKKVFLNYSLYHDKSDWIEDKSHMKNDRGSIVFTICGGIKHITEELPINDVTIQNFKNFTLDPGYYLQITMQTNCSNVKGQLHVTYERYDPERYNNGFAFAGIRIKQVNNYDTNGDLLTFKKYTYLNPDGTSSGYFTNKERLIYENTSTNIYALGDTYYRKESTYMTFADLVNGPNYSTFAYGYVQEYSGSTAKDSLMFSNYQYTQYMDEEDPNVPNTGNSHLRGKILNKTDYLLRGSIAYKIKEETNYYSSKTLEGELAEGFYMNKSFDYTDLSMLKLFDFDIYSIFSYRNYEYQSSWLQLDSISENYILPQQNGDTLSLKNKTIYSYASHKHLQPISVESVLNKNESIITKTLYPEEANKESNPVASYMCQKNLQLYPLEIKKYKKNKNSTLLLHGTKYNYENISSKIQLVDMFEYLSDNKLYPLYHYKYNEVGRLIEYTDKSDIKTSILWDKENINPLVIAKNCSISQLIQAYNQTQGNTNNFISKLPHSDVSLFEYKPLIGLCKIIHNRGISTTYDYDGFARLINIKDYLNNILKSYKYNLQ